MDARQGVAFWGWPRHATLAPVLALFLAGEAVAVEISPALAGKLAQAEPRQALPVIVHLEGQLDLSAWEPVRARRRELVESLRAFAQPAQLVPRAFLEARGVRVEAFWIVNALAFEAPADVLRELARLPGIARMRLDDRWAVPEQAEAASAPAPEWNIEATGAPALWASGITGAGTVVAILDTGADLQHPDLRDRWRSAGGWFDAFGQHASPVDPRGHGTQVLGLIVGGAAGGSSIGMAPGARFIVAKVFDDSGTASVSAAHRAMQWALDPDGDPTTDDAPDVVNNSWDLGQGQGECDRELEPDVKALAAAGIAVVFAAGNTGPGSSTSTSPANYLESLSVGAVERTGAASTFSARGPSACDGQLFPDLAAPGAGLRTSDLTAGGTLANAYATVTGTSFSAPQAAGALALLLSMSPRPTAVQAQEALLASASRASAPDNAMGYGMLNAPAAYRLLQAQLANPSEPGADAGLSAQGGAGAARANGCGCRNSAAAALAGLGMLGLGWARRRRG